MSRFEAVEATMEQRAQERQLDLLMPTADDGTRRLFDLATRAEIVSLLKALLSDRLAVVELIGATTTRAGLKVECALDPRTYEKGVKVSDAEMAALYLEGDEFHPEWNYSIKPRNQPDSS